MIWKIETIEENDQPVEKSILKNAMEMAKSLIPRSRNTKTKCSRVIRLIRKAQTEQRQGDIKNRSVRQSLREAYDLLSQLESERDSTSKKQERTTGKGKTWAQKYLSKSLSRILNKP